LCIVEFMRQNWAHTSPISVIWWVSVENSLRVDKIFPAKKRLTKFEQKPLASNHHVFVLSSYISPIQDGLCCVWKLPIIFGSFPSSPGFPLLIFSSKNRPLFLFSSRALFTSSMCLFLCVFRSPSIGLPFIQLAFCAKM
jgi:hypothetical protein